MTNRQLASIIINNYNYGQFLRHAIDSALAQDYPNVEIIIVDDGSTDESRDIIQSYGDRIIPVLKENGGQASAFNAGFATSRGAAIFLLDADDRFCPEKVSTVMQLFEAHPSSDWCFHTLKLINKKNETLFESLGKGAVQDCDFRASIKNRGKVPIDPPATSGLCFQRDVLDQILPMPEGKHISIGDHYLKFSAMALSKGLFLEQNLAQQVVHGNNAYTLKVDNQQMKARILVMAAYWIKFKFPDLGTFTNNLLVRGISAYWRSGGIAPDLRDLVDSYLSSLSRMEKFRINTRAFYRYLMPKQS
ncbi:MAG: glycosyltransferase family A protein [Cyanobacteria bacterium P01_E01_bin.6]